MRAHRLVRGQDCPVCGAALVAARGARGECPSCGIRAAVPRGWVPPAPGAPPDEREPRGLAYAAGDARDPY